MYEAVHAHPDGDSTAARLALTAGECGYDGIVVRNHGDEAADYDPAAITEAYDVDVVEGVEVRAEDPSRASGLVGTHRSERTIVAVHGGTAAMNRFAVETPAVDVLAHPMAGDGDFNQVLAKAAAENGVRVEFSLDPVLTERGGSRVRRLQDLRKLRELVDHYDVPFVVSADATSHLGLRAPRELIAVGEAIGFDAATVETGLAEWATLAQRNRALQSERHVADGVWLEDP